MVELDYEAGWQDAIELGQLGQKAGIRVEYRLSVLVGRAVVVDLRR